MENLILTNIPLAELISVITETVKSEFSKQTQTIAQIEIEYITRKEAAKLLGISLPTLNSYSKQGIVPAYRIGSGVRYKKEEVLRSLSKVKTSP